MGEVEYQEALKLGKREQKNCLAQGHSPYLPVLDEILTHQEIQTEQPLGLINIPLEFVVGTSTRGRTCSFAANFMPILEQGTEFSAKWSNLADAQVEEGIREPIIAYEFMNRYYVVEGNKRVSVLKFFKADSIAAMVTRKIPKLTDDEDVKIYYEYMKFQELTGLNNVEFRRLGNAEKLIEHVGVVEKWDRDTRDDFDMLLFHFAKAFEAKGGKKLGITIGDAIVTFLNVYGYEQVAVMSREDMETCIAKCWSEFVVLTEKDNVDLVMDPKKVEERKHLLRFLLPSTKKKFTVAFLYPTTSEASDWTYAHDLGCSYLEESFPDKISTIRVENVTEENI